MSENFKKNGVFSVQSVQSEQFGHPESIKTKTKDKQRNPNIKLNSLERGGEASALC